MIKVTKIEFYINNSRNEPVVFNRTIQCPSGRIYVRWETFEEGLICTEIRINEPYAEAFYLTGKYFKRIKVYFENGYIWDTVLKPEDDWRRMIYEELKKYVDSGCEDLPGEHQSELSRAARLLDDEMQYEI